MSIVVRFSPTSLTKEKYDESIRRLEAQGDFPPDGLLFHVFFGPDDNLLVSEVWESREQFAAFGERLLPVLTDVGIGFSADPEVFEVHHTIER